MFAIATPLDMISLAAILVTAVCFLAVRRRMQHKSARLAALVFAISAVVLRGTMLAHGFGMHGQVLDGVVAALGTTCNASLAWVMVVEPPIGRGGLANRLHEILHNAATHLDPDSPAGGEGGMSSLDHRQRETEEVWASQQKHP